MDLTPYKNQLNALKQCITNVKVAQTNYRKAEEACSYGVSALMSRLFWQKMFWRLLRTRYAVRHELMSYLIRRC